jgi:hypothetical protein
VRSISKIGREFGEYKIIKNTHTEEKRDLEKIYRMGIMHEVAEDSVLM